MSALTHRERQIMRLISDGLAPKEIAQHLHISGHTVKEHMKNVSRKLHARNGKHAVALFLESRWEVVLFEPHPDDAVLFACYTLLRERPFVITVLSDDQERILESKMVTHFLSLEWERWGQNENNPDWGGIKEAMIGLSLDDRVKRVWLPMPEHGGHEHHNRVGEIGLSAFGERARFYATYLRGEGRTRTDTEVVPQPSWPAMKFKAMGHYISQINDPQMRPWFNDWDREWVA